MNPYMCAECSWKYVWTMGDRVKAVKRHELAHLTERRHRHRNNELVIPDYRLAEEVDQRLRAARLL